ncbi:hypothetical protein SVAN01_07885 [Stagonosporopsis vannaccii]|nr:hypothetical protein SVAN01_07885 [Stagonosporopsis vannaccii]
MMFATKTSSIVCVTLSVDLAYCQHCINTTVRDKDTIQAPSTSEAHLRWLQDSSSRPSNETDGKEGSPVADGCFTVFVGLLLVADVIVDSLCEDVAVDGFELLAVMVMYIVLVVATRLGSRPGSKIIGSASASRLPSDAAVAEEGVDVDIVDSGMEGRFEDEWLRGGLESFAGTAAGVAVALLLIALNAGQWSDQRLFDSAVVSTEEEKDLKRPDT